MIIHNFAFRWKPHATSAQKARAAETIRDLHQHIPGILATFVGVNFSPRGQGYEFGGSMHFADRATLEAYVAHPVHQQLLAWLGPLIDPLEVDFEA